MGLFLLAHNLSRIGLVPEDPPSAMSWTFSS